MILVKKGFFIMLFQNISANLIISEKFSFFDVMVTKKGVRMRMKEIIARFAEVSGTLSPRISFFIILHQHFSLPHLKTLKFRR